MYFVVKVFGCCILGVFYQKLYVFEFVKYLELIQCSDKYLLDIVMDDFVDKRDLDRYLVVLNMFSYIGFYLSLSSKSKNYVEFYLMFKLQWGI